MINDILKIILLREAEEYYDEVADEEDTTTTSTSTTSTTTKQSEEEAAKTLELMMSLLRANLDPIPLPVASNKNKPARLFLKILKWQKK